jgi:hypothetical protein
VRVLPTAILAVVVLVLLGGPGPAESKPEDYLSRDGKLKEKLEVWQMWGITRSHTVVILPSGKWTCTTENSLVDTNHTSNGQLSKKQLASLARELARYDLRTLKHHNTNPRGRRYRVLIRYGKKEVVMVLGDREPLPKSDPRTLPGRFGGIVRASNDR